MSEYSTIDFEMVTKKYDNSKEIKQLFIDKAKGTSIDGALKRIETVKILCFGEEKIDVWKIHSLFLI